MGTLPFPLPYPVPFPLLFLLLLSLSFFFFFFSFSFTVHFPFPIFSSVLLLYSLILHLRFPHPFLLPLLTPNTGQLCHRQKMTEITA